MIVYFFGANSQLSKIFFIKLKKSFNIKLVSSKKNFHIQTKIFRNNNSSEKWIKKISSDDAIVIFSGITNVIECEKYPKKYKELNKKLIHNFIKKIKNKPKIIYLSSDYVFCGKKNFYNDNSITKPCNNYGKQKKYFENYLKKNYKNYLILRLPKIYCKKNKDIFNLSKKNSKIRNRNILVDQKMYFLEISILTNIFRIILNNLKKLRGAFNLPGDFFGSRFELINKYSNTKKFRKINLKDIKNIKLPLKVKMRTNLFKKISKYSNKLSIYKI